MNVRSPGIQALMQSLGSNFRRIAHSQLNYRLLDRVNFFLYKTAVFADFVCENKYDLVAITETSIKSKDVTIRVELCPVGYKFVDHPTTTTIIMYFAHSVT